MCLFRDDVMMELRHWMYLSLRRKKRNKSLRVVEVVCRALERSTRRGILESLVVGCCFIHLCFGECLAVRTPHTVLYQVSCRFDIKDSTPLTKFVQEQDTTAPPPAPSPRLLLAQRHRC